jgi:hypothetical protein
MHNLAGDLQQFWPNVTIDSNDIRLTWPNPAFNADPNRRAFGRAAGAG